MTRRFSFAALAVLLAGVAVLSAQGPVFRGTGEAVRVYVTVTDKDGRIVTTLAQTDFEVRDEGKPQPITLFDNTPQPIRLIVLLDVSGSMEGNLPLLRAGLDQLLARLGKEDLARVGTFGHEVALSPKFTNDPLELRAALPTSIDPQAPTPLWRALDTAIKAFKDGGEGRPVILVLSDGKDSGMMSFKQPFISQGEVIDRAREADVMVFGVGMRSRGSRPMPGIGPGGLGAAMMADFPDPGLALVSQHTGGGYSEIRYGQDLGAAFAKVADELHSQYLLGYAPPKKDGKVHEIEVRVTGKGLTPRARKSYIAQKE